MEKHEELGKLLQISNLKNNAKSLFDYWQLR